MAAGQCAGPPGKPASGGDPEDPRPVGRRQEVLFLGITLLLHKVCRSLKQRRERLLPYCFVRSRRGSDRRDIGKEEKNDQML